MSTCVAQLMPGHAKIGLMSQSAMHRSCLIGSASRNQLALGRASLEHITSPQDMERRATLRRCIFLANLDRELQFLVGLLGLLKYSS
jgi:hypothetical protein